MREWIANFARKAGNYVPDAAASSVIMLFLLVGISLALGDSVLTSVDAFYRGLWMLLPFSMQMTLILVLSSVLSMTDAFRRAVRYVADLPRTVMQVIALAVVVNSVLSYLYWGLSLAMGPLIAVYFAEAAERKGLRVDFPFLLATVFAAGSVWQYGLSSTAALLMATPGHFLEKQTGIMALGTTIGSLPALLVIAVFPLALILLARFLMPQQVKPISAFPHAAALAQPARESGLDPAPAAPAPGFSGWTERTWLFPFLLCIALATWLYHHFVNKSLGLELNSMITVLLLLALLMQRNFGAFSRAMAKAVVTCWPVIVLYQLYGGVAGVLQFTRVGTWFAQVFSDVATPLTFPLLTAIGASIIAIFVPSSGGQWIIQGFVTVSAANALGATPQQGLLALGVGDQMGNLLAPFWVVVAAGIARIDFREIFGHLVVFAMLWFVVGVSIFTFVK
jgi:short-chain fatty acids transporter